LNSQFQSGAPILDAGWVLSNRATQAGRELFFDALGAVIISDKNDHAEQIFFFAQPLSRGGKVVLH
jgi:hypothetical protein